MEIEAIRRLDRERLDEPRAVIKLLDMKWESIGADELFLEAQGIYASCFRQIGDYNKCIAIILEALAVAREMEVGVEADLLHRCSVALASRGRFAAALEVSTEGLAVHLTFGCRGGVGRILVSQGNFDGHLAKTDRALRRFREAQKFLEPKDYEYLFASHLGQARCFAIRAQADSSIEQLTAARALLPRVSRTARNKFIWNKGRIALQAGRLDISEAVFGKALECFQNSGQKLEAALAAAEWARVLMLRGKNKEAAGVCQSASGSFFGVVNEPGLEVIQAVWLEARARDLRESTLVCAVKALEKEIDRKRLLA